MFTTITELAQDVLRNKECLGWFVTPEGLLYDTGDILNTEDGFFPWKGYVLVAVAGDYAAFVQEGDALNLDRAADFLVLPASERGRLIQTLALALAEAKELASDCQNAHLEVLEELYRTRRAGRGVNTLEYLAERRRESESKLEGAIGEELRVRHELMQEMLRLLTDGAGEMNLREDMELPGDPDDDEEEE